MEISVVIPVYNEEEAISNVVSDIKRSLNGIEYEIIVVDDNSTDKTSTIIKDLGVKVITHHTNYGYGASIMSGIKNSKYDIIVTIDGDASYPAEKIKDMLQYLDKFDIVIGNRTGKEYTKGIFKFPLRIIFRWFAEYVSGEKVPDINSGMRIFRKSVFASLPSVHICRGFSFSTTMTLMYLAGGYTAKFIPIEYRPRRGKSKVRYVRDTLRAMQILLEIAVYYNPIKAVIPLCVLPMVGSAFFLYLFFARRNFFFLIFGVASLYFALALFSVGLILFQIRMSGKYNSGKKM